MLEHETTSPRARARFRFWPWLVLAVAVVPSIWSILVFESDVDPEFPRVVRPTFSVYPPAAYRLAEAGDSIDHAAVYLASAALVLSGWGLLRGDRKKLWLAALGLSLAAFWHAATPGPLMNGWHGLGWRTIFNSDASNLSRAILAVSAAGLLGLILWCLKGESLRELWQTARDRGIAWLIVVSAVLVVLRQTNWLDFEPFGYWPRWFYAWGLLAWALALVQIVPASPPRWRRVAILTGMVALWLVLDVTGRGIFWYQRPIRRLREIVPGRVYLSAMPTYQGLEIAQKRHGFKTIINLFNEHSPEQSPYWPEELQFVKDHGLNYVGNEPTDDPTGTAFISRTLDVARDPNAWPILVHCHASMDRSPAWVGVYRFIVQQWPLADAIREIERHRGLRPKASVTLMYSRLLPQLDPDRSAADPTVPLLQECSKGTEIPIIPRITTAPHPEDATSPTERR